MKQKIVESSPTFNVRVTDSIRKSNVHGSHIQAVSIAHYIELNTLLCTLYDKYDNLIISIRLGMEMGSPGSDHRSTDG